MEVPGDRSNILTGKLVKRIEPKLQLLSRYFSPLWRLLSILHAIGALKQEEKTKTRNNLIVSISWLICRASPNGASWHELNLTPVVKWLSGLLEPHTDKTKKYVSAQLRNKTPFLGQSIPTIPSDEAEPTESRCEGDRPKQLITPHTEC